MAELTTLDVVRQAASEEYGLTMPDVAPESKLADLGDSLDAIGFAMELEERFEVDFDDDELSEWVRSGKTLADVAALVDEKIAEKEASSRA